jgi:hypothetical protein
MLSTAANTETSIMSMGVVLCEYADQIQEDEVTLHVAEGPEKCIMHTGFWWGNSKEREPSGILTT